MFQKQQDGLAGIDFAMWKLAEVTWKYSGNSGGRVMGCIDLSLHTVDARNVPCGMYLNSCKSWDCLFVLMKDIPHIKSFGWYV